MIGRVKKFLGIEGVKLQIIAPEVVSEAAGEVAGALRFQSMHDQTVTRIRIVLVERYSRGRGKDKMVDDYQLGETEMDLTFDVPAGEVVEKPFTLPFKVVRSDIEEFGAKNFLFSGLARMAKLSRNVRSDYRIEAEAYVRGTALNPFDTKPVRIK